MAWSYERLWILLIKKKIKRTHLLQIAGINANALSRMGKDLPVTMDNLGKICKTLHCELEDIVQYIPDEEDEALLLRLLETSLTRLPVSERDILERKYKGGESIETIANGLNITAKSADELVKGALTSLVHG